MREMEAFTPLEPTASNAETEAALESAFQILMKSFLTNLATVEELEKKATGAGLALKLDTGSPHNFVGDSTSGYRYVDHPINLEVVDEGRALNRINEIYEDHAAAEQAKTDFLNASHRLQVLRT